YHGGWLMRALLRSIIGITCCAGMAHAEPVITPVQVASGYIRATDCVAEADPTILNECICKADIKKAVVAGVSPAAASVMNTQLAQVPEQMATESCAGEATAAPAAHIRVNEVNAQHEVVYQSP